MTKLHKGGNKQCPDHDDAGQVNVDHACLEKAWIDGVILNVFRYNKLNFVT